MYAVYDVYLKESLQKIPYIHRKCMVLTNPNDTFYSTLHEKDHSIA